MSLNIKEILAAKRAAAEGHRQSASATSQPQKEQPVSIKEALAPAALPAVAHNIAEIVAAKEDRLAESKTPEEMADHLYDTWGFTAAQQKVNGHITSNEVGTKAFIYWRDVAEELRIIRDIELKQEEDPLAAVIKAKAIMQPTKNALDAQKLEERKSGFRREPEFKMTPEQEAAWIKAVYNGDLNRALNEGVAKYGISSAAAMILSEEAQPKALAISKEEPLVLQKPAPAMQDTASVLLQAAKPMSLAERIAAKKAAAQARALAEEPAQVLADAYQDDTGAAQIPAIEAQIGTASAATSYEQAVAKAEALPLKTFDLNITLNEDQIKAKDMAMAGQSFCLIGPAGSGKTTTQREVAATLLQQGRLHSTSYKLQGSNGARVTAPSIAFVAYTRRAAANLQRAVHKLPELEEALRYNIMTIHALLEFEPIFYYDEEKQKETMRFEPQRHAGNPLDITHLVIEEASMVGLDLWTQLYDALPSGVQIIFIGDINQLPPVFGPSILNYALVQLPVVELSRVYRQEEKSHILGNAHRILAGDADLVEAADFQIMEGKQPVQVGQTKMAITLGKLFELWHQEGHYDPEQDMILSPYNVQDLGTDNMNKFIAQFLGQKRGAKVYEVIAGFTKHYLAVGDRVMCNKQDGVIEEIVHNGNYMGAAPQPASAALSRFGLLILDHPDGNGESIDDAEVQTLSYEGFSLAALEEQDIERKMQASHIVKVRLLDSGAMIDLTSSGDFGPQVFSLGYVLTVHKAQGCEWRKVFFIMHKDHATMRYRELVYTAVTRAREYFLWVAKRCYIEKAIHSPRIKGNCLADKIEYFNANLDMAMQVRCVK